MTFKCLDEIFEMSPLGFDDKWKPSQVFLALRTSCKYFSGQWEDERERGQVGEPLLVFCNHPSNSSDVEGNCNEKRCPLLANFDLSEK